MCALLATGAVGFTQTVLAEGKCTGEQIQKMLQSGFTKDEVINLCQVSTGGIANQKTDGKEADTLRKALTGHRWEARSHSLVFEALDATFNSDGTFNGFRRTSPESTLYQAGPQNGRWQIAKPFLFIKYVDVMTDAPPVDTEHTIEIREFTEHRIVGVDKYFRMWELIRKE